MSKERETGPTTEVDEPVRSDGFAAMAILALTVVFIVVVLVALI